MVNPFLISSRGPVGKLVVAGWAGLPKRGGTKPIRLPAVKAGSGCGGDSGWRNEANPAGVGELGDCGFRNGVAAGIFHYLQCSAGPMGIRSKLLILLAELVVIAKRGYRVLRGRKGEERGLPSFSCRQRT